MKVVSIPICDFPWILRADRTRGGWGERLLSSTHGGWESVSWKWTVVSPGLVWLRACLMHLKTRNQKGSNYFCVS